MLAAAFDGFLAAATDVIGVVLVVELAAMGFAPRPPGVRLVQGVTVVEVSTGGGALGLVPVLACGVLPGAGLSGCEPWCCCGC